MKRFFYTIFISLLFCFSLAAEEFVLLNTRDVEYKDIDLFSGVRSIPGHITYDQMVEDVKQLSYILSAGYAGYDDMFKVGFRPSKFEDAIINSFNKDQSVLTRDFFELLCAYLKKYINDGHFQLFYNLKTGHFCTKKIIFWSDTYLIKDGFSFYVYQTNNPELKQGEKYSDTYDNLFYYPVKGQDIFRLGFLEEYNDKNTITHSFKFNDKEIELELKNDGAIQSNSFKYHDFETPDSAYISINSFFLPPKGNNTQYSTKIIFDKFARCGKTFNRKKNIIVDLRHNSGGSLTYPATFYYILYKNLNAKKLNKLRDNTYDIINDTFIPIEYIYSPVSQQARNGNSKARGQLDWVKIYESHLHDLKENPIREKYLIKVNKNYKQLKNSKYKGKLIFIIDRNTVSAGEMTILQAKTIFGDDNVIVVGENSYGMSQYWDLITLGLPNSKIGIHTAFEKKIIQDDFSEWAGDGVGIFPDYWTTGADLNQTIFLITNDLDMKERLKNIEFSLQ